MGATTSIEWTDATWNPVTGCTKVSPGCAHCYAERLTNRFGGDFSKVVLHQGRLWQPFSWREPRRIFVCSMGDLFHSSVPFHFVHKVFSSMAANPRHIFQILTKRPGRLAYFANQYVDDWVVDGETTWGMRWPAHIWAGVSVESAKYLPRLDVLARVPAKVRFVSVEPMLGLVDLRQWLGLHGNRSDDGLSEFDAPVPEPVVNWLIVGGESGPHARPMEMTWLRDIVAQCRAAGVPCFTKQDSGLRPGQRGRIPDELWIQEQPEIAQRPQAYPGLHA